MTSRYKLWVGVVLIFCSVINNCLAVPNMWYFGTLQGFNEYGVANQQGDVINISCNVAAGEEIENSVTIKLAGGTDYNSKDEGIMMEFLIADEIYPIPVITTNIQGSGAWDNFITAISQATEFEVYINNKSMAVFKPKAANVKKALKNMDCISLAGRQL